MRYLLLSFLIFPLLMAGQECKLTRETDPYTKEVKLSSGFISLSGGSLTIDADNKEIDFFFVVPDKCFSDVSTVFIFFEGSKAKMSYRNAGSMNCDGYFHFKFRNTAGTTSLLQKLSTQKVAQFIFTGNDKKEAIITLSPEQQKIFTDVTACIVTEGKTLIK